MQNPNEILKWPDGVAAMIGLAPETLQARRRDGDAPQLYAVAPRSLVTTVGDVLAWIKSKPVDAHYRCREATVGEGAGK